MNDTDKDTTDASVEKPSFFRRLWTHVLVVGTAVKIWAKFVWTSFLPNTLTVLTETAITALFVGAAVAGLWYFGYYSWLVMAMAVISIATIMGTRFSLRVMHI